MRNDLSVYLQLYSINQYLASHSTRHSFFSKPLCLLDLDTCQCSLSAATATGFLSISADYREPTCCASIRLLASCWCGSSHCRFGGARVIGSWRLLDDVECFNFSGILYMLLMGFYFL